MMILMGPKIFALVVGDMSTLKMTFAVIAAHPFGKPFVLPAAIMSAQA